MSGHYTYSVQTGSVSVAASATQTIWLLDPVTNPVTVAEIGISFNASAATNPAQVTLYRATAVGSAAGSTGTVSPWLDSRAPAATTTALTALTTEPTTKVLLASWFIQPFGGLLVIQYPLMREPGDAAAATGTDRLGIQVNNQASTALSCVSYVVIDEG